MVRTKSTSKRDQSGDPRARPHQSITAYNTSLKWHLALLEKKKKLPTRVRCTCHREIGSTPSARKKHVDTHLPLDLRQHLCPYCRKRFAQATQRQCHENTCKQKPPEAPNEDWPCGIVLHEENGKLFACGYQNPHARALTRHRQSAHGQLNREESHDDAREGRRVLSGPERKHADTYFVPMPVDCSSFDLESVPECYHAAVGAAAQREVDNARHLLEAAAARREAESAAKGKKVPAQRKGAMPPRAPSRRKGKGKGNAKPTAAATNAKRKPRAATALSRSVESPVLSELISLPPSSGTSPSLSSPTTATSSSEVCTASTRATSPGALPQEPSPQDECPTTSAPSEPYDDEPYVHSSYSSSSYAAPPHARERYAAASYTPRPPALPCFQEAFGNVPLPRTVWSHLPPSPDTRSAGLHTDTPGEHIYHDRARPHASAPVYRPTARYEPYSPVRARAHPREYEEFTQGSSKDGRVSEPEREAYRYPPLGPPLCHSAAHASSVAHERRDRRDEGSGLGFTLRLAQW
ncbi:hypothetical protein PsYK624_105840 [Phanerochaete sordida]|uniref:Uncharacterized protein n=1 Tax=Phanerochaete sordida TaxID=48140 RepID=A0A9P3GGB5_9APHY|nr:hypothetical protein PsYK624_105840 [Phanerochaete sordida]